MSKRHQRTIQALRSTWLFLVVCWLLMACGEGQDHNPTGPTPHSTEGSDLLYRGVNLDISGRPSAAQYDELEADGVRWIALIPFGWQSRFDEPEVRLRTTGVRWSETDEGLREISAEAQERGMGVLLKPHIWLTQEVAGEWRGTIRFDSEQEWQQWEADYRTLILHYAALAAAQEVEMFSVGVELHTAIRQRPAFWERLIADVRAIYPGTVTYGANWFEEFEDVQFWDLVDVIGIHAYFPLTNRLDASIEDFERGWQPHAASLEALCAAHERRIAFLEVGYRSIDGAAVEPWNYDTTADEDLIEQEQAYEALFRTFWAKPWFGGLFLWKWNIGARDRDSYSPQGKPAERVISDWFLGEGA